MKVSVIIPTYGEPVFLREAIESVIRQTMKDWELIIVDDNNPQTKERRETEVIVSAFCEKDPRIKYLKHPMNKNGAAARNTGLQYAQGDYVAFLDSDDIYMPQRLQKCCDVLDNAPYEKAGIYTGCEFRRSGKKYNVIKDVKAGNFLIETLAGTFMFCTGSNIFMKRSVITELHGFDESFIRHQDYEFLVRYFEKYSLEAIPEVLVIKNNENFNLPNPQKTIEVKKQYLEKYKSLIEQQDKKIQNSIYNRQYIAIAESGMRFKDYQLAKKYYEAATEYGGLGLLTRIRRIGFLVKNL
mgnify:FL=1